MAIHIDNWSLFMSLARFNLAETVNDMNLNKYEKNEIKNFLFFECSNLTILECLLYDNDVHKEINLYHNPLQENKILNNFYKQLNNIKVNKNIKNIIENTLLVEQQNIKPKSNKRIKKTPPTTHNFSNEEEKEEKQPKPDYVGHAINAAMLGHSMIGGNKNNNSNYSNYSTWEPGKNVNWKTKLKNSKIITSLKKMGENGVGFVKNHLKGFGTALILTILAYAAYKTFQKKFSYAAKACANYHGDEKSVCMQKIKNSAIQAQITDLRSGMSACVNSKDPIGCRNGLTNKINSLSKKLT